MVEIGKLEIAGTINVENIKSGLSSIKRDMEAAKGQAKSFFGDLTRIGSAARGISTALALGGVGLLGAITKLASAGPQTSAAMAGLEMALWRLAMAFDEPASKAVEEFTGLLNKFNDFLEQNPWAADLITDISKFAALVGIGGMAYKGLSAFKGLIKSLPKSVQIGILLYGTAVVSARFAEILSKLTYEDIGKGVAESIDKLFGKEAMITVLKTAGTAFDTVFGTSLAKDLPEIQNNMTLGQRAVRFALGASDIMYGTDYINLESENQFLGGGKVIKPSSGLPTEINADTIIINSPNPWRSSE